MCATGPKLYYMIAYQKLDEQHTEKIYVNIMFVFVLIKTNLV